VPDDANGFSRSNRDFRGREPLVVDKLDGAALAWLERRQELPEEDVRLARRETWLAAFWTRNAGKAFIKRIGYKETACSESSPPIECALVSENQEPGPETSALRVELTDRSKYIDEDLLRSVFGLRAVAQNPTGDTENEAAVPREEDRKSVRVSSLQPQCEFLVCSEAQTNPAEQGGF